MTQTTYSAWWFWVNIAQMCFTALMYAYVWWSNREKVNATRFKGLEDEVKKMATISAMAQAFRDQDAKCGRHKDRTTRVESALLSMPSRQELSDLSAKMDQMTRGLGRLDGRLEGINRVADLMNEFLINQGGKR
ncbi:MAG: hypothetical protein ABIL58_20030 [Pseudomonadota bacterium]